MQAFLNSYTVVPVSVRDGRAKLWDFFILYLPMVPHNPNGAPFLYISLYLWDSNFPNELKLNYGPHKLYIFLVGGPVTFTKSTNKLKIENQFVLPKLC